MLLIYLPAAAEVTWVDFWLYVLSLLVLFGLAMWQKVKRMKAEERARGRAYRHRKD